MQIKLTKEDWESVKYRNDQNEYPIELELFGQLKNVFSIPQIKYVYLSYEEFNSIMPFIPRRSGFSHAR